MHTEFLTENLTGRGKLGDTRTDKRTALKWILMSKSIGV
jgi:hypothetical protein